MSERTRSLVFQVLEAVAVVVAVRVAITAYPHLENATRSTWNTTRARSEAARRRLDLERTVRRERHALEFEAYYATREAADNGGD